MIGSYIYKVLVIDRYLYSQVYGNIIMQLLKLYNKQYHTTYQILFQRIHWYYH